jgi:hypothetical protein
VTGQKSLQDIAGDVLDLVGELLPIVSQSWDEAEALLEHVDEAFEATAERQWPAEAEKVRNSLNMILVDLQHLTNALKGARVRAEMLTTSLTGTEE